MASWSPHPSPGPHKLLTLEPTDHSKMRGFVGTDVLRHKDCTTGVRSWGVSFNLGTSPFFAPWQRGYGSRPAQKTDLPPPTLYQLTILVWTGQRWVWPEQGEGAGCLCPEKAPGCAPAKMTTQLQNQKWAHSGLWAPCPRPPQVPSLVTHVSRGINWSLVTCDCSRFTLNIHVPGHPTCHPGTGSCMLGSWFLFLYVPHRGLKDPQASCVHQ